MSKEKTFSDNEVRNYLFKTHLKNHAFEFILKIAAKVIFAILIVFLSKGTEYLIAILLGAFLGITEVAIEIKAYATDHIEYEIKKRNT